ncbi:hypothetical protein AKJ09_01658 [Labilithrix luteola]|uniref:Gas vesicle protein GvpG n=2 Tax=Labilithrix luteola TaxID=1391654 RepID=A0A0K1PPE5_9BACT|nr:hypothetical protein AKJ09_01658 [Labilithrix luteola]
MILGLLTNVLLAPVTGPIYGVRFVLNALKTQAETELEGQEKHLQEELVALNMRMELGQISEPEFEEQEATLLKKLRNFRAGQ